MDRKVAGKRLLPPKSSAQRLRKVSGLGGVAPGRWLYHELERLGYPLILQRLIIYQVWGMASSPSFDGMISSPLQAMSFTNRTSHH